MAMVKEWNEYEEVVCPWCGKMAHLDPCKEELEAR
jgi:uncharacterized Zn-finger protein